MWTFILNQIQQQLRRKILKIIKKPYYRTILGRAFQNMQLCHNLSRVPNIMPKLRKT